MKRILIGIVLLLLTLSLWAQSPHGEGFTMDCALCHTADSWTVNMDSMRFDHNSTSFALTGQHRLTDCKSCHTELVFSTAKTDCISCHNDMHSMTVGDACARCHHTDNWLVDRIPELHEENGFPLILNHSGLNCIACHGDVGALRFERIGNDCISCHAKDYEATISPNHLAGGFSKNCLECHDITTIGWRTDKVNHDFFPLTLGHDIKDCKRCHVTDNYSDASPDCKTCHANDFIQSKQPAHERLNFPMDCASCHTTDVGWKPAKFDIHDNYYELRGAHALIKEDCAKCHTAGYDNAPNTCFGCHEAKYNATENPNHIQSQFSKDCSTCHTEDAWTPSTFDHDGKYFPIYSGKHEGEWNACVDCHKDPADYGLFTCITCHTNPETDDKHKSVSNYFYRDQACLGCHPTGDADNVFDHNNTAFPLTGAHQETYCIDCHANGYAGTPTDCVACHNKDYDKTTNPEHKKLNLSTDCASCHTTDPEWKPARFDNHDDFFVLEGAHAAIAMECVKCHNGDYTNTPNECVGCHRQDYDDATNPNHATAKFSTDCVMCHTQSEWRPSTFDHDGENFPIYSGEHEGEWSSCTDCHTDPNNISVFSCTNCHKNPKMDEEHRKVKGYVYNNPACLGCHPTGDKDNIFDHDNTAFPLTGVHQTTECTACHTNGGFEGLTTGCVDCHQKDYDASLNPSHNKLRLSKDCASCHNTDPDWAPARFDVHNDYYLLEGAHAGIATDCAKCHNGDYTTTPNECVGCHRDAYDGAKNPDHARVKFSTDCEMCHTQSEWKPSTFDHDGQFFPIYSGKHEGEWSACTDCHTDANNIMVVSCTNCHKNPDTDEEHKKVKGYIYSDAACLGCHPTGDGDDVFDHDMTAFPLTGEHQNTECFACHTNGNFEGLSGACVGCHQKDYDASINPSHTKLNLSTDCAGCHTTDAGWAPATFEVHNDFYELNGAHADIATDCAKCHNGDYVNNPKLCVDCHRDKYDATTNPVHETAGFSTECQKCHTETAWTPADFDHDAEFFPIYSGTHKDEWNECVDCHTDPMNYAVFTCVTCHEKKETGEQHEMIGGYIYKSIDCLDCHPMGEKGSGINHDDTDFPLVGSHMMVDCRQCHEKRMYKDTPKECYKCHKKQYDESTNPDHQKLNLETDCLICHTMDPDWQPAMFPQHEDYWEFTGAHVDVSEECEKCHHGDYNKTPKDCNGCHQSNYDASTNPNHKNLGLSHTCDNCHTTEPGWKPATFDVHDDYYELTGAHIDVKDNCAECHHGDYNNTPTECKGCHQSNYDNTTNPNHVNLGLSNACDDCHTTEPGWKPATFDVHDDYYPLTGAHQDIKDNCADCHNGDYNNTPNQCSGCHQNDYDNTTNPDHVNLGLSTACDDCHTTEPGWKPATFDVHDNYYPLTGAHLDIKDNCADCHNGDYNNTPNQCSGCHQSDYDNTTNPSHTNLGLSTTCDECHTTAPNWKPATFDIHDDYWELKGKHKDVQDCYDCHQGDYNNTPTECYGCHQSDYNNADDPDHSGEGYPTTCEDCHAEDGWEPSSFDHDAQYFPIYSGKHDDEWNVCADCHLGGNFNSFSCIDCHEHDDQAEVDDDHDGVSGYSYNSDACYSCHPEGKE